MIGLAADFEQLGDIAAATQHLTGSLVLAKSCSDEALVTYASFIQRKSKLQVDVTTDIRDVLREGHQTLVKLMRLNASEYSAMVRAMLATMHLSLGEASTAARLARVGMRVRSLSGANRVQNVSRRILVGAWLWGPMHVDTAIERCEAMLRDGPPARVVASAMRSLGLLKAMQGEFESALSHLDTDEAILHDLALLPTASGMRGVRGIVELLRGNPSGAEETLRPSLETLRDLGERWFSDGVAVVLAQALHAQGKDEEAWRLTSVVEDATPREIMVATRGWGTRARICARNGDGRMAEALAWKTVRLAEQSDHIDEQANA